MEMSIRNCRSLSTRVKETFALGSRRVMVFTNYRATAARLVEELSKQPGSVRCPSCGPADEECGQRSVSEATDDAP